MNKLILLTLLSCFTYPALAEEVISSQNEGITTSNLTPANTEINDYLSDLSREDAALGAVMTDVVKIKRERCQLDMGVQDIKLIANKDTVFKDLESEVDKNPTYVKSFRYANVMKSHFGKCF